MTGDAKALVKRIRRFTRLPIAVGFGIFLSCYSAYMLLRPPFLFNGGGRMAELAAGFAGGVTGGATAMPGAIRPSGAI